MSESQKAYIRREAIGVAQRGLPKTCPYCGNAPSCRPVYLAEERRYAVYCYTDEFFGPRGETPELALLAWNYRAKEAG